VPELLLVDGIRWGSVGPIAASVTEGSRVNAGDPESCGSAWLDQPVDPFRPL